MRKPANIDMRIKGMVRDSTPESRTEMLQKLHFEEAKGAAV